MTTLGSTSSKWRAVCAVIVLALVGNAGDLAAQNCSINGSATLCDVTVAAGPTLNTAKLSYLTASPAPSFSLNPSGTLGGADFAAGFVRAGAFTLTAWTNTTSAWSVTATPTVPPTRAFTAVAQASASCPTTGTLAAFTGTTTIMSQASGPVGGAGVTGFLCLRTTLRWTVETAGSSINLPISFAIVTP